MMNIDKYINWELLWKTEVSLAPEESWGLLDESMEFLKQFIADKNLDIIPDECCVDGRYIYIVFGEEGGKNESDHQGWSRDYCFRLNSDFLITGVEYNQG